jgi:uncharacterized protein (DUF849 family)
MGAWAVGPAPDEAAIEFHLHQIPDDIDVEWMVVPYTVADPSVVERICRRALALGGNVRVGVGDNPQAHPDRINAALVEDAARWADEAGRPLASSADVRSRFALT